MLLWYKLDESVGTVAADASGNGRDGTVAGTPAWTSGQGLGLNGSDTYLKAPNDLLTSLDAVSVSFDVTIDPAQSTPYFLYGLGNTDTATGYGDGYLFATGNAYRNAISTGNWSAEQNTRPADGHNPGRSMWKTASGGPAPASWSTTPDRTAASPPELAAPVARASTAPGLLAH